MINGLRQKILMIVHESTGMAYHLSIKVDASNMNPWLSMLEKMELKTAKIAVAGKMSPIEKSLHEAVDLQVEFVGEVGSIVGINIIANSGHLFKWSENQSSGGFPRT